MTITPESQPSCVAPIVGWGYHRLVTMRSAEHSAVHGELDAAAAAACLFQGFSDRSRVTIVQHLTLGEHRVVDLTQHLGLAQSTVSKHLACLLDCGLVAVRPEGRASYYSLAHLEATLTLLAAAEELLALTGDAVVLCPTLAEATTA